MNQQSLANASQAARQVEWQSAATGRCVTMQSADAGDVLEISAADGTLELRVTLTEQGPVLQMRAARLALEAADTIQLNCRQFDVQARDGMTVESQGPLNFSAEEMRVRTVDDIHLNGAYIRLNCPAPGESGTPPTAACPEHDHE